MLSNLEMQNGRLQFFRSIVSLIVGHIKTNPLEILHSKEKDTKYML